MLLWAGCRDFVVYGGSWGSKREWVVFVRVG